MKRLIAVAVLCLPALAQAQAYSKEGGREHLIFSAVIGMGCANVFQDSIGKAYTCALAPGLVKEIADSQTKGNKFSGSDMAYNALGAAIGVYTGHWLIHRQGGVTVVSYRKEF